MKFSEYDKAEEKYEMGGGGGEWMNLQDGENKVRLITEFEDYGEHWSNKHNRSFICVGSEDCPFCAMNAEAQKKGEDAVAPMRVRYLGWVIDRSDNEIKLLRIGHQIFKQIGELSVNDEYKFEVVPSYDITIKKAGKGLNTEYTVLAARKDKKLTKEEKKKIDEIKNTPHDVIDNMKTKMYRTIEDWGMEVGDDTDEIKVEDIPF